MKYLGLEASVVSFPQTFLTFQFINSMHTITCSKITTETVDECVKHAWYH